MAASGPAGHMAENGPAEYMAEKKYTYNNHVERFIETMKKAAK